MASRVLVALRVAAPPERVFAAFTEEIGVWWRPNDLFRFRRRGGAGRLAFEPGPSGRLVEVGADGRQVEVGRVLTWEPPARLVLTWRHAGFADDQATEVHVRFDAVDEGTRVTVEHLGWDAIPQEHVARHGLPLAPFQQRLAEWWRDLLDALGERAAAPG